MIRPSLAAVTVAAILALGACGSDEPSGIPTPDASQKEQKSQDETALTKLAEEFWAARTATQRNANPSREQFDSLMEPPLLEAELGMLQRYRKLGVTRTGKPAVTNITPEITGDTARVMMCLNEDNWTPYAKGREIKTSNGKPLKFGTKQFTLAAKRSTDGWLISDFLGKKDDKTEIEC